MSSALEAADKPFHLRGNYAPVPDERTEHDLEVEGALPPELSGLFVRNGPNPRSGDSPHWFAGDGMLHGVRLEAGAAHWYRNRWVRTRTFETGAQVIGEDGSLDLSAGSAANTNVIAHAGRLLALVEIAHPTEVDAELATIGPFDFDGKLGTAMTAHPKRCPRTGELHFFGYGFFEPFLTYHCADAAGRLLRSQVIDVPGATMMHDFAITESHVVFMDLPIVFDPGRAMAGSGFPYGWSDDYGARVGVMPRTGGNADVRWFEVEPCYVFHPMNAFERDGRVVVDVARYPELWRARSDAFEDSASLHRWELGLEDGVVRESPLDERSIEFPRIDERRLGSPTRYGYCVSNFSTDEGTSSYLVKYDLQDGSALEHDFGSNQSASEGVFVPAGSGAAEDEGWVLTYVYDRSRDGSDLVVLDAMRLDAPPVARVRLPQRVPYGFHGSWVPADELPG